MSLKMFLHIIDILGLRTYCSFNIYISSLQQYEPIPCKASITSLYVISMHLSDKDFERIKVKNQLLFRGRIEAAICSEM